MVADNNKEPASNKETASTVNIGNGGKTSNLTRKLPKFQNKKKLTIVSVLIIIGLVAGAIFGLHVGQKMYAQAAGHKIYKQDVEDLIGKTKGISDHQAATVLADKYLTEALAKEQKITITDKDIEQVYGPNVRQQKTKDPYSYQLGVNQLYFDKLQAYNRGMYEGDVLVAHFSRFIPAQPRTAEDKAAYPALGDPAAIAADKKYAQDFITKLYNQVKTGKLTWGQAAQIERNDPIVGEAMYPALTHSGPFNTTKAAEPLFTPPSIQNEIRKIGDGQTSKPLLAKVSTTTSRDVESYYLVVHMNAKTGGQTIGFGEYLSQAEKRLGYKIYV